MPLEISIFIGKGMVAVYTESIIAAIVAFLGGTGFTAILRFLSKNKETNITTEAMLRQEMMDRLDTMSIEIEDLKREVCVTST
jgi:hypothetical protein